MAASRSRSSGAHPSSPPAATASISASVIPQARAMRTCCTHSYSERVRHATRSTMSSRQRGSSVGVFSSTAL